MKLTYMKDALMIFNSVSFILMATSFSLSSNMQNSATFRGSLASFLISFIGMLYADEESKDCKKEIDNLLKKKKVLTIN